MGNTGNMPEHIYRLINKGGEKAGLRCHNTNYSNAAPRLGKRVKDAVIYEGIISLWGSRNETLLV
jgi:hypothetical protein